MIESVNLQEVHKPKNGPTAKLAIRKVLNDADPLYGMPKITDQFEGHATIQPGADHKVLNTDLPLSMFGGEGNLQVKDYDNVSVKVVYVKQGPAQTPVYGDSQVPLSYTVVYIVGTNRSAAFYTRQHPTQIRIRQNVSVKHAALVSNERWFTYKDLVNAMGGAVNAADPTAAAKSMFGSRATDAEALRRLAIATKTSLAPYIDPDEETVSVATKDEYAAQLSDIYMQTKGKLAWDDGSGSGLGTFYVSTGRDWNAREPHALNIAWYGGRVGADDQKLNKMKSALGKFTQNGISIGVFRQRRGGSNAVTLGTGFKLFNSGSTDYSLRQPVSDYLHEMAEIEASYMIHGSAQAHQDRVKSIYRAAVARLRQAYRHSDNIDNNGVVSFDSLIVYDTPSRDNIEGMVFISPAMFEVANSYVNKVLNRLEGPAAAKAKQGFLGDLEYKLDCITDSVRETTKAVVDGAFTRDKEKREKVQALVSENVKGFIAMLKAYDPTGFTGVDGRDLAYKTMNGWTRLTQTTYNGANIILIPPTVKPSELDAIVSKHAEASSGMRGYRGREPGEFFTAQGMADMLYEGKAGFTARIALDAHHTLDIQQATDLAEQYLALPPHSPTLQDMQLKYKFAEYRPSMLSQKPTDIAEERVLEYLNSLATGSAGKEYHTITEAITKSFRDVYAGTMNGNKEVAHTLMQMGRIYLPKERMTVLFGPSGALYKVLDYKGSKPTIEEIPARIFSGGSLYMKVLKRLSDNAKGLDTGDRTAQFVGNGAFSFSNNAYQTKQFVDWADNIRANMENVRSHNWADKLKGLALYSRLQGLIGNRFRGPATSGSVVDTDRELNISYNVNRPSAEGAAASDQVAAEAYDAVVKYIRNVYAEQAMREEEFQRKYNVSQEVAYAMTKHYQGERERLVEDLQRYHKAWIDVEQSFESTMAKMPETKRLIKSAYELERAGMAPSLVDKFVNAVADTIAKIYVKFTEGFHTMFDLMNPIKIVTNLKLAAVDAIIDVMRVAFSSLFTNFVDRHFEGTPFAKDIAKNTLAKLDIKIYNNAERKLLNDLRGSNKLAYGNRYAEHKHAMINATFRNVRANPHLSDYQKNAMMAAVRGPDIAIPLNSQADNFDHGEFDVVYTVHDPVAFRSDEFAKVDFESLRNKDTRNRWWRDIGFELLFPSYMGSAHGDPEGKETNRITQRIKDAFFRTDISNKVLLDGNDIRIRFRLDETFGIKPRDIYGTKADLRSAERMTRTDEDVTAEQMRRRDAEAAAPKPAKRQPGMSSRLTSMTADPEVQSDWEGNYMSKDGRRDPNNPFG